MKQALAANQTQTPRFPSPRPGSWLALVAVGLGLMAGPVPADTLSWSGGGGVNANWDNSANWGYAGTPANGDTLVFPAGQPNLLNTNNISSLVLNQIRFAGAGGGYDIRGNAFTLTNSIMATNSAGANSISNNITLATTGVTVNVASGSSLTLAGALGGTVGVTKTGAGTLTYSGPDDNTYSGPTVVNEGLLELNKSGFFWAIGYGSLIIGDNVGGVNVDIVRYTGTSSSEINASVPITLYGSGWLDLNGQTDSIGALTFYGGDVTTGAGQAQVYGNITANLSTNSAATISGNLSLGFSPTTIYVADSAAYDPDLSISAVISGGAIIKTGAGTVRFSGANTYTGLTQVQAGTLKANSDLALGTNTLGTVVSSGACLYAEYGLNNTSEPLTVAGSGPGGVGGLILEGDLSWNTNIVLAADTLISCIPDPSYTATINGLISGPGGFTKSGSNVLVLAGPGDNTYLGDTFLKEGRLDLKTLNVIRQGRLTIGDGLGGSHADEVRYLAGYGIHSDATVLIRSSGFLNLNGWFDDFRDILFEGGDLATGAGTARLLSDGDISAFPSASPADGSSTISGQLDLYYSHHYFNISNGMDLDISANIVGSTGGALTKTAPGWMYLQSSNSYPGLTVVADGYLVVENAWALGTTNAGTIVSNSASLVLHGNFGVTNESLTLNGVGASSVYGALDSETSPGTNIWTGPIALNADSTIAPYWSDTVLRLQGPISGAGGLTKGPGTGTLYLEGALANTYAGSTRVDAGTLLLTKSASDGAIPHNLSIGGTVRLLRSFQISNSSDVSLDGSGRLEMNGFNDYIDELSGSGEVDLGTAGAWLVVGDNNGFSTYNGSLTGAGDFYKFGDGTITLTGTNTYTGGTYIYTGTLLVNGYQPASPVGFYSGTSGSLGGTGVVGPISAAGHIRPGTSAGCLTSSNLTFTATGNYYVELLGTTPCTSYDQMIVRGTNTLSNAVLHVTAFFSPAEPVSLGDQFVIINNDGAEAVTGTFSGLADGAEFDVGSYRFRINYGNDVVLTAVSLPLSGAATAVSTGNGNHAVDPNECNFLDLVLTNQTGSAMTNVAAVLSTTHQRALVTQPYSDYPDIPNGAQRTNTTPFQVATLANFTCGNDIPLQLAVSTTTHGSFVVPLSLGSGLPATSASRYDNNIVTNVPDVGTIESTNTVATWSGGPLTKVAVSLWLVAPWDADLNLTLIAPDGTAVDLSSGNGAGANFGTGSADTNRTTFDDAAALSITAGTPPFVGSFQPEGALASLLGSPAVGNWRLRIQDGFGYSTPDTLRAWSLFLYGVACTDGGGACDLCLTPITGSITGADPSETNRVFRDGVPASCGAPKDWPGIYSGSYHYDVYGFTNLTGADACVTVELTSACNAQAILYLGGFDPLNISNNYVADAGLSTGSGTTTFSGTVPAGAPFFVTVNEVTAGSGCPSYTLQLSGLPCPPPTLAISPAETPNHVRVHWPTWAGGYKLEANPTVAPGAWNDVTTEPIVSGGRYNVTNQNLVPPERFYRLRRAE